MGSGGILFYRMVYRPDFAESANVIRKSFFSFLKKIYVLQSPSFIFVWILVYMYEWPGVYTIRTQINFHRSQEYFFQVMPFFLALGHWQTSPDSVEEKNGSRSSEVEWQNIILLHSWNIFIFTLVFMQKLNAMTNTVDFNWFKLELSLLYWEW